MTLFEDRKVEALYLQHAKSARRARIVPPVITALALIAALAIGTLAVTFDQLPVLLWISFLAPAPAIAGFATSCAQAWRKRVQYQLRVAALALAVASATAVFVVMFLFGGGTLILGMLGLLWVSQKALIISDVVAARVLVVLVPFNALVLLTGVAKGMLALFPHINVEMFTRAVFELGISIIASSGSLLWVALRNESSSRTVFYWSRVVGANVEALDAEANPFHQRRLQNWLSRDLSTQEMATLTDKSESDGHLFWELDGALLTLGSKIAAGGGGVVWKATYGGKAVAAKQLYSGLHAESSQLQELATEVGVLAQLSHANVVRFLGLCRHPGDSRSQDSVYLPLFIVQEYCATNLRAMLTDILPAMPSTEWQSEVLRVALEIANAMAYLHSRKVLHRDLKPENILLTDQHTVRVADFGVSMQFLDGANPSDGTSGTPAYMSPEAMCSSFAIRRRSSHEQSVDEISSDAYAFGVILCELVHSDSAADIMDTLAKNAVSNRRLSAMERSAMDDGDFERQWALPPFRHCSEPAINECSEISRQCCAFYPSERPAFADVYQALTKRANAPSSSSQLISQTQVAVDEPSTSGTTSGSVRSVGTAASDSTASVINATCELYVQPSRTPRLSAASIELSVDIAVNVGAEQSNQAGVEKCACSCWTKRELRFADVDAEWRFVAFLHADEFFRYLRWPYVLLAILDLVFTATMFALDRVGDALYPLLCTILFGAAALFSWTPRIRRYSMITLTTVAFTAVAVQCLTSWAEVFVPVEVATNDSIATLCLCVVNSSGECPTACQTSLDQLMLRTFLLPLLQDLTIPVTLLGLGLPFYLYAWLLGMSVVSWMGSVIGGVLLLELPSVFLDSLETFCLVAIPGVALFSICTVTAIAGERLRRQMFLKLCSLRTQESSLLEHATFRGYREALLANWHFLAASPDSNERSHTHDVVTEATIIN